jgi:Fe-S oxidoreductase
MGLFSLFEKSNTVYFPGCITYFKYYENFELYKKIFLKLGIKVRELDKKLCCGREPLEAGYESESRKLARKNFESFKQEGIDSIITTEPGCYSMFLQNYPNFLPDWNIEVYNIWEIILNKLKSKSRLIRYSAMEKIGFHDSCYLGRYCKIYDAPRRILNALGYEIDELSDSRERSICCGSCGGLVISNPDLANEIARQRILQFKRKGIKKLVVCSFENYDLLKRNSKDSGIEIFELSEILALGLGIKKKEVVKDEEIEGEEKILSEVKSEIELEEELKEEDYYNKINEGYETKE